MSARLAVTLAAVALAVGSAHAQDLLGAVPGGQYTLLPADPTVVSTTPLFVEGAAGGRTVAAVGTVGGVASAVGPGQLSVGFDYLRPFWSFRDFTLPVPPAYAAAFPALADVGHADNQFAFAPQVRYNYYVEDLD